MNTLLGEGCRHRRNKNKVQALDTNAQLLAKQLSVRKRVGGHTKSFIIEFGRNELKKKSHPLWSIIIRFSKGSKRLHTYMIIS